MSLIPGLPDYRGLMLHCPAEFVSELEQSARVNNTTLSNELKNSFLPICILKLD